MARKIVSKQTHRLMETLEARRLLSATQLSFPTFSSLTGIASNGYGSASTTTGTALLLTDSQTHEARSDIFTTKVPIDTFTSHFSFHISGGSNTADGLTFVIENDGSTALGGDGLNLGYIGGTFGSDSVALALNTYNVGSFGSTFGFSSGGTTAPTPVNPSPVDLHSGDTVNATVTYSGTTLSIELVDAATHGIFNDSETINLPQLLGGHTAFVGFTAGTGTYVSSQRINSFNFSGSAVPTLTTAAASTPTIVTGKTTSLSVTAQSNTGGTLSYDWTVLHKPAGAKAPKFAHPKAATTTTTFYKAGTYHFRVTITDSKGGSTVSDVTVVVEQTATGIRIEPHKALVAAHGSQQFRADVLDQFGHLLSPWATITYAIVTGQGSIDASTGLYSAADYKGHLLISASADGIEGVSGETVA